MKQIFWILVITSYLIIPSNAFCQNKAYIDLSTDFNDSLTIEIADHQFLVSENVPKSSHCIPPNHSTTSIILTDNDRFAHFSISTKNRINKEYIIQNFLIEPGDSLVIKSINGILEFSGKGSVKNEALYNLVLTEKTWIKNYQDSVQRVPPQQKYTDKLDSIYISYYPKKIESGIIYSRNLLSAKLSALTKYKSIMSSFIYDLIMVNLISKRELDLINESKFYSANIPDIISLRYTNEIRNAIKMIMKSHIAYDFSKFEKNVLNYSGIYLEYILAGLSNQNAQNDNTYSRIKHNYDGVFRDRLLTTLYLNSFTIKQDLSDSLLDAMNIVTTEYCKSILRSFNDVYSRGKDAFNFSLPDVTGNLVSLSDLRGKVVLIDFWFTGCAPCRTLANHLKVISRDLRTDTSIVFVSINVDKDKSLWLKSVKSQQYTSIHSLDLNTGPAGRYHDLIKFYKITGYPKLLVIDPEGRIYSASPEIPKDKKSEKELVNLLLKAKF